MNSIKCLKLLNEIVTMSLDSSTSPTWKRPHTVLRDQGTISPNVRVRLKSKDHHGWKHEALVVEENNMGNTCTRCDSTGHDWVTIKWQPKIITKWWRKKTSA